MITIITTKRLKELENVERKYHVCMRLISDLCWLSEFPWFNMIRGYLTGENPKRIEFLRDDIRTEYLKAVDFTRQQVTDTMAELKKLKDRNNYLEHLASKGLSEVKDAN